MNPFPSSRKPCSRILRFLLPVALAAFLWPQQSAVWSAPKKPATKARPSAKSGVQELYGLDWHGSVDRALKVAREESPKKPVFWLRMLGDLGGYT